MKCIVTGGAGFIGSHLCELLLEKGHQVIALDNLVSGKLKNFEEFEDHPNFFFQKADIRDRDGIKPYFKEVDWVFHLAALADIVPSIERPEEYYDTNVTGTFNVLQAAKENNAKKFVYTASSSCYGLTEELPTTENAKIDPEYPYALTKFLGEKLVTHWNQLYNLPTVSLRLFNVYGPKSRTCGSYGAVLGVFLAQKLKNKPFTVVGDGSQTRDFTFVTDVVDAFYTAAKSDIVGEIFNVGSGGHYSINKMIELIGGDKVYIPKRPGEPDCTFADTTKITKALNWKAKVPFEKGMQKVLGKIESWNDAPLWEPKSIELATKSWFNHLGKK